MINKSIKYIGVILLAYTLNACNEQRMSSSSETTTPVWLAEVGKRDVRELTTTTGTAKAAQTEVPLHGLCRSRGFPGKFLKCRASVLV